MLRNLISFIFCISFVISTFHCNENTKINDAEDNIESAPTEIVWHDFDDGLELALKTNRIFVVDFYTEWCHWCKVMDEKTYSNEEIIKYASENLIMAKVDAETSEKYQYRGVYYSGVELRQLFGVQGYPSTCFFESNGDLLTTVSGYIEAERFILMLQFMGGRWYEVMSYNDWLEKQNGGG